MKFKNIIETTLVPHTAFENAVQKLEQAYKYAHEAVEPICVAVIGESRTGKSRVLEEMMARYPRTRKEEGLYVPILRVTAPSKPTVKGLAELMLRKMGDPRWNSGTENVKTERLKKLLPETFTHMIMIDEFQHFQDKGTEKVMHHVADWLKNLVDDCKVALVVAGLPACSAIFSQNEQLDGRFLAPALMPRFNWMNENHHDEFVAILGAFHEELSKHFDMPDLANEDMAFRCYCAAGGLIGYLTKYLRQAVWDAIDQDRRVISLNDLRHAYKASIWERGMPLGIVDPFNARLKLNPTLDVLEEVKKIGTSSAEIGGARRVRSRKQALATPTPAQILCAT
ncbi:MAG TPA: TniB family NTP-binding protein [Noviherbaspirillum sp.]